MVSDGDHWAIHVTRPTDIVKDRAKFGRGWTGGLPETPCGFGSKLSATELQRRWIPATVAKYHIKSVGDVGAGDLNWVRHVEWPGGGFRRYVPYDLVPRDPSVVKLDIVTEIPPQHDLLMCLWVLNHLPEPDARMALDNLRASGCGWLMLTFGEKSHAFVNALEPVESIVLRSNEPKVWRMGLFRC